jgi:hypothetical protein
VGKGQDIWGRLWLNIFDDIEYGACFHNAFEMAYRERPLYSPTKFTKTCNIKRKGDLSDSFPTLNIFYFSR